MDAPTAAADPAAAGWLDRIVTRARVRRFAIAILAVNVALYAVVVARGRFPFDAQGNAVLPDFMAHLTGGALVAGGHRGLLYDVHAQHGVELAITHDPGYLDIFVSPPLTALFYAPFAPLPYGAAAILWTGVSAALLVLSGLLLRRLTPSVPADDRAVLFVAAAASQPVIQLLGAGQDTGLSLLLWVSGVALALRRRDLASGLAFSLGLFKPQLFVLPPLVFLARGRWRALGGWGAGAAAQAALSFAVFGVAGARGWWGILHSPEYLGWLRTERALRMTSLRPFVESLAPRSWAGAAGIVGGALSLGGALATLYAIRRESESERAGARAATDLCGERAAWALACVAALLVSPHCFTYDLTLLVLPVALLLELAGDGGLSRPAKLALLALYLLTWTAAARGAFEEMPWPARVLSASWAALPMAFLWLEIRARVVRTGYGASPPRALTRQSDLGSTRRRLTPHKAEPGGSR